MRSATTPWLHEEPINIEENVNGQLNPYTQSANIDSDQSPELEAKDSIIDFTLTTPASEISAVECTSTDILLGCEATDDGIDFTPWTPVNRDSKVVLRKRRPRTTTTVTTPNKICRSNRSPKGSARALNIISQKLIVAGLALQSVLEHIQLLELEQKIVLQEIEGSEEE